MARRTRDVISPRAVASLRERSTDRKTKKERGQLVLSRDARERRTPGDEANNPDEIRHGEGDNAARQVWLNGGERSGNQSEQKRTARRTPPVR